MPFEYDKNLCPECNGEMIARSGQYGKFWGCKNFPTCKGTRDSQGRSKQDRAKWKAEQVAKTTDSVDLVNDETLDTFRHVEWNRNVQDKITFKKN